MRTMLRALVTSTLIGASTIVVANAAFTFDAMSIAYAVVSLFASGKLIGVMWA